MVEKVVVIDDGPDNYEASAAAKRGDKLIRTLQSLLNVARLPNMRKALPETLTLAEVVESYDEGRGAFMSFLKDSGVRNLTDRQGLTQVVSSAKNLGTLRPYRDEHAAVAAGLAGVTGPAASMTASDAKPLPSACLAEATSLKEVGNAAFKDGSAERVRPPTEHTPRVQTMPPPAPSAVPSGLLAACPVLVVSVAVPSCVTRIPVPRVHSCCMRSTPMQTPSIPPRLRSRGQARPRTPRAQLPPRACSRRCTPTLQPASSSSSNGARPAEAPPIRSSSSLAAPRPTSGVVQLGVAWVPSTANWRRRTLRSRPSSIPATRRRATLWPRCEVRRSGLASRSRHSWSRAALRRTPRRRRRAPRRGAPERRSIRTSLERGGAMLMRGDLELGACA